MSVETVRPPPSFWLVSIGLLFWGLGGASIYIAYFVETPEQFASSAENAAHQAAYAQYVADIPWWAIGVGMLAAATRLLGAVALLLRRAWAQPLYVTSLVAFSVALYRAFVLAGAGAAMSAAHIATEVVFVALGLFAIWFSRRSKSRGILR